MITIHYISFSSTTLVYCADLSNAFQYRQIIDRISIESIYGHIKNLSSIKSRVTGYPGCDQAAMYISRVFQNEM